MESWGHKGRVKRCGREEGDTMYIILNVSLLYPLAPETVVGVREVARV